MANIRIKNVEVLAGNQVKIIYNQNVKVDASYNSTSSYTFAPPLTVASVESTALSTISYSIVNLTHHMLDLERYTVTVSGIVNLIDEGFDEEYDSYDFLGNATKPSVVSSSALNESTVRLTYDRIMDSDSSSDTDNYLIVSQYTGHSVLIDSISYNSTYVDITINTDESPMTDGFDHDIYINNVEDYNGNVIQPNTQSTFEGICTTLTELVSATFDTSQRPEQLFLVFDRAIDESSVLTYGSFEINPDASGIQAYYNKVRLSGAGEKITLDVTETTGGSTYTVVCGSSIRDVFGNTIDPANNSDTFTGFGHQPSLSYIEYASKNIINVYFDEPIRDNFAARNTSNYSVTGGISVVKIADVSNNKVCVITTPLIENTSYTLSVTSATITDGAGNGLTLPANATATTPETFEQDFASNIDLYKFVPISYRDMDDSTLLQRYIGGFQIILDELFEKIRTLKNVPLLDTIEDEHLYYVRTLYGWRGYESLLNRLSYDEIRKLYANSIALFKRRGAGGAVSEALELIVGANSYETDVFDDKFLLDTSHLIFHCSGYDAPMLDLDGIYTIYIKIVDPDDELDHEAIEEIVSIWKQSDRFIIQYLLAYEPFDANFSKDNYTLRNLVADGINTSYTVSNNLLDLSDSSEFELFYIDTKQSYSFEDICFHATFMSKNTTTGKFGIMCGYVYGDTDEYRFEVDPSANELVVKKGASALTTVDLSTKGLTIEDDRIVNLKIEFQHQSGTNYYNVYVDGNIVLSSSHTASSHPGSFGVYHLENTELEVYKLQCSALPAVNTILN